MCSIRSRKHSRHQKAPNVKHCAVVATAAYFNFYQKVEQMKKRILYAGLIGFAALFSSIETQAASKKVPVKMGSEILKCEVGGGIGLVLGSSKTVSCEFHRADGKIERYTGTLGKFGLDIGITQRSYLAWAVGKTKSGAREDNSLSGDYEGISADAAIGFGLGANVLVGGAKKSFVLQPFSTEETRGINVAVGVSRLRLVAVDQGLPREKKPHSPHVEKR